ncbi:MAG: NTP transferase domain-containing protein [Lachnospiraceae bacterium]|nr:NTP transferase domain-containing protein [Lachnospiraceae bacterium]
MNAIILAAGKSNRFAPFTYEKPKGLFRVRGEVLIDRQIEQLREAGIKEIIVVIGFMKEKFFYLEEKYGVKLVINNSFSSKGNLYSLYTAREYLHNTFICCADHYFLENPFLDKIRNSYRACVRKEGQFREFAVEISDADIITDFRVGGCDSYAMVGQAYFSDSFSKRFVELMEQEISDFGISSMFWEEFYGKHQRELTLYASYYDAEQIQEFESVEDLRQFDQDFLNNIDSDIVKNICSQIECLPNSITDIEVIDKGLTNVSFRFCVDGIVYVYRHPGGTAGNLVDRHTELYTQYKARELGIDKSVIYMDLSGWKLSYYVNDMILCDLEQDAQLMKAMEYLHMLHAIKWDASIKQFDTYQEALKLMRIASATKGNLFEEFAELKDKAEQLDHFMKTDGYRREALCHNDVYAPNYLITASGEMYLIDWEYAGVNDQANDIACICCRYDFSDAQIERYLRAYVGRDLTYEEHRHYIAAIALCGFYWFCWGLYKGSVNDDDGFFFLPAYRNCRRFAAIALDAYKE